MWYFHGYFEVQEHKTETRNIKCLLKLPKIKTEYACKSFHFMGAKIYMKLLIEIRGTDWLNDFRVCLKKHLIWMFKIAM